MTVHLDQGWPTFLLQGQNYLEKDLRGLILPMKLKFININTYCFDLHYIKTS